MVYEKSLHRIHASLEGPKNPTETSKMHTEIWENDLIEIQTIFVAC